MTMTLSPWRDRIVGTGSEAPDQLLANPKNWRIHPKAQQDALGSVLDRVGWVSGVLVNRTTGHLVDGHLRVELAISRGEPSVPVSYVELTAEEEALVLASLDPLAAMAGTDPDKLRALLGEVTIDSADLEAMLRSLAPEPRVGLTDPDVVPEVPDDPYVQPGELWLLGDHRLVCGDSTKAEDVGRLMGDVVADAMFTDPPYGVAYIGKTRDALTIANDALTPQATEDLIVSALERSPLRPGAAFYVCSPAGDMELHFRLALIRAGLHLRQSIAWVKDVFVMGRQDYHWRHESILYGWVDGAAHYFVDDRTQDTVWDIARPRRSEQHPTMKPVELVGRALENSSNVRDVVYEPFAGSGSTIIAAEQLNRRCYAMEIDPRYAQVAIERWQAFTGKEAVRGG